MADASIGRDIITFGVIDPQEFATTGERILLDPLPLRALATAAIWLYNVGYPMKQFCKVKPEYMAKHRQKMLAWWGIETKADAVRCLEQLVKVGHRASIQLQLVQNESEWRLVFDRYAFLRGKSIASVAGWDYCRIVSLAAEARSVDILDDNTAFHYIHTGAQLAAERFHSWEELAVSYLAGRIMWRQDDPEGDEGLGRIADYLLHATQNVWMQCPWEGYRRWW